MAIRFPKEMCNNWILKMITFPPPREHFLTSIKNGKSQPPRISFRDQERIRQACFLAGIDAEKTVGLPPVQPVKLPKHLLAKGSTRELEKVKREQKIAENLAQMDKRIETYRQERRAGKLAKKPELPF